VKVSDAIRKLERVYAQVDVEVPENGTGLLLCLYESDDEDSDYVCEFVDRFMSAERLSALLARRTH
jgi:hypothetical protein